MPNYSLINRVIHSFSSLKGGLILALTLLCLTALVPQRAFASSVPFEDTFDSGVSAWTAGGGYTLFQSLSSGCQVNDCAGRVGSGNYGGFRNESGSTADEGAYSYYFKLGSSGGGRIYGFQMCFGGGGVVTMTDGCAFDSSAVSWVNGGGQTAANFAGFPNDGAWHQYSFFWRNGATYKEFCQLRDDTDIDNCTWGDNQSSNVPIASHPLIGVQIWTTPDAGSGDMVDELVGLETTEPPAPDTSTHIISVEPAPDYTGTATTTLYLSHVGYYLSGDNYSGGDAFLRLTLQQMGGSGPTGIHNLFDPPAFYESAPLEGGVASTTEFLFPLLGEGTWSAALEFRYPTFFSLFSRQIPNTPTFTWQFDVGSTTPDDKRNAQNLFRQAFGNTPGVIASTTATPSYSSDDCDILSSAFFSCLTYLFNGQDGVINTQVQNVINDASKRWPFGYGTIVVTALSNPDTDTGELPDLNMDISTTGLAPLASAPDINLSPWVVMASTSLLSTAEDPKTHRTLREIVEPGWTVFVHLLFTLVIFTQLMGFGGQVFSHGDADGSAQENRNRRSYLNSRRK